MEAVAAAWGAIQSSQVFQAISAASTVMSAFGQISQGQSQGDYYEFQAAQTRLQTRGEAVKYEQQANAIARRSLEAQAIARARAAAGGIDPFSGSAQFVQTLSAQDAAEEIDLSRENARLVTVAGQTQAQFYEQAGRRSRSRGLLSGFGTLLEGASRVAKVRTPAAGTGGRSPNAALNTWRMPTYA